MLHAAKKYQKSALYALVALLILGVGFSSFAQFADNAYVVRTVHIFPSEVSSNGWQNAETLNFQNLDEYALLQDFNAINSATLSKSLRVVPTSDIDQSGQTTTSSTDDASAQPNNVSSQTPPDNQSDVTSSSTTDSDESTEVEADQSVEAPAINTDQAATEPEAESESSTPETETTEPQSESPVEVEEVVQEDEEPQERDTATTTVLREVRSLFAFAMETLTETFSSTSPAADEASTQTESNVVAGSDTDDVTEVTQEAGVIFGFTNEDAEQALDIDTQTVTSTESSASDVPTPTSAATQTPEPSVPSTTVNVLQEPEPATTTNLTTDESSTGLATTTDDSSSDITEFDLPDSVASTTALSDCGADCSGHVLRLGNFGYPLDEGVEVSGAQLRVSFAAKHKQIRETLPFFTMNYSFDDGATWSTGGSILIDDEVSNSINGGYFLFALPAIDDSVSLADLQIELRYDDDPALLSDLFVESAWLELFVLEPPSEPTTPEFKALLEDDGFIDTKLSGDRLVVSDTEVIDFDFTDENSNETLIIKSSKKTYDGLSQTTTYFSVTNTSDQSDDFTVQTYFPQNMGEVTDLAVFNLNKPRNTIVPEFRPYIYHCEAGWEVVDAAASVPATLADLSIETASGTVAETTPTSTPDTLSSDVMATNSVPTAPELFQTEETVVADDEQTEVQYSCGATNVVRSCDALEGDGTACSVTQKVRDHEIVQYSRGWDAVDTNDGEMSRGGVLKRAAAFLGFGPDRKDVPESFEGRVHTDGTFAIAPGETRYFKMDISYPAFSSGEYWIEVIGDSEYGLLDPFWSSLWRYRKPITIDNTGGAELVEQQFFLELDSAASGFWSNVQSDGGDIRFVSETPGNDLTWWDTNWENRVQITIPAASVDEDLTDFPVFVDLNTLGSAFFTDVASDGRDIRVLDDAGVPNEYAYDLVAIDTGAETGELHFKATSLSSSTDNVFYLYFNNPSATAYAAGDTYGSQAVWSTDFDLRYAMDDNPTSNGDQFDSTSNGNNAAASVGMNLADVVTGQVGQAINYDGNDGATYDTALAFTDEFSISMWWRASGNGFAIAGPAGGNEKIGPWSTPEGNLFVRSVASSDTTVTHPADGTWTHVVLTRDSADKVDVYLNGVRTRLYGDAAQGGTSDWINIGGQSGQQFLGDIDELRFTSLKRSDGWISTEYNNQSDPGTFYSAATVESLVFSSFVELDHWVQHFDSTAQEADIWVQVDRIGAAASTTIQLYYGNATAESESDEYTPFTYSTSTDLYYVVNDTQTTDIIVYSLIDGNEVSIDGGTPVTLQSGETTSFAPAFYASTSVISALGPITARSTDNSSEPPVPISFATTTHISTTNRGSEDLYIHAPFTAAAVEVYAGGAVTPTATSTVAAGNTALYSLTLGGGEVPVVESDEPILFYQNSPEDSFVAYPPTLRDLYGVHSNDFFYSSINDGASVEIYCSSGASGTTTGMTRGGQEGGDDFCTSGTQGTGPGVRLANQTEPIGASQQADGGGTESSRFLPTPEFGTRYILPVGATYATIVCAPRFGAVDVEMQTVAGGTLNAGTCTPSGESPGVLNFTASYSQGTQVVSTNNVPFFVYYNEDGTGTANQDETNTWSAVQAKKFNSLYVPFTVGAQEVNTDAQYEQNNFRWYDNTNGATPGVAWPAADGATVAEGESIATGGAVNPGDVLRLRMNLLANNGTGTIESTAFELQYTQAQTCSAVVGTAWTPVAQIGSTTPAFAGSDNAAVVDGSTLPSSLLSDSDVVATYEEQNVSAFIPNQVDNGQAVEFDWVIEVVAPEVNSQYCFRMVRASTGGLASYATYPQLLTAGPPGQSALLTPFNNEHVISTLPNFTFVAADVGGDALDYEIEIATDAAFSSIVESADSDADPFDFENVTLASDKAPFNNGQVVRYLISSPLSNGQTYWWRVRAIDTGGSNTYGTYSTSRSFTINTAVTVSEWFQTTDEQFDTNSLIGVRTSGSDFVELDIAGSNLVGEYGTIDVTNGATTSLSFVNSYTDPVVVTSIRYSRSVPDGDQPSPRVSNKSSTGFDVNANNFSFNAPGTSTIDWIVMEAGEWIIDDGGSGRLVFATSTSVSASDGNGIVTDPGGPTITFPTSFGSAPAVYTTVTTINDPQWTFSSVYDGNNRNNSPTASQASVFLNDSFADDGHGASEDVDLIAFDAGAGSNNGVVFDVLITGDDVTDTPNTRTFAATFASTPAVILVGQHGNDGGTGSYGMVDIDTPPTATTVTIAAEEAGSAGGRGHTTEEMAVIAFQDAFGDLVRSSDGQLTSSVIDYDDVVVGNAWGEVSWNDSGDVTYRVQYNTGSGFQDIPDSALSGNAAGFTTSPINILNLDTDIYNQIRLVAEFSGVNPELFDWTVTWGQRVEVPELGDPYDNEKTADTTPTFDFTTTDPQGDALDYEISYSTDPTFESSSTTIRSDVDFTDFESGTAGPYASGATVTYTIPGGSPLSDGETYWWRVRAKDPAGNDSFSPWSEADNFTVDTATSISTWFQTTQAQFQEGVIDGVVASTTNSVELSNEIGEYNTVELIDNDWVTVSTELTYNDMVVVVSPEYNFEETLDNGRTPQVRNKTRTSFEIKVENPSLSLSGTTTAHYMVMEAGDWVIEDGGTGTRIVAGTAENVSAVRGSVPGYSGGTVVDFVPDFTAPPTVFATVAADGFPNGSKWVATVLDDGSQAGEVTAAEMNISLGIGLDSDTVRAAEDVDYVAVDVTTGENNGTLFDSFNSPDAVTDADELVAFNQIFASTPGVIVTHNNATDGGDGGFSQVDNGTPSSPTQVSLSIAEMPLTPPDYNHAPEIVSVLAFEAAQGTILRDESVAGGLAGTIASEPVLFTDGLGPKFGQALISATTPGASTVVVQFEYLTPGGDFELIPDVELAGNSTGFTTATIDMTGIDVGTYQTIRLLATLSCDGVDCPTLDDWAVEWSEGVEMSGTLQEYDRITNVANATVTVSVNGGPATRTGVVTAGVWSISSVTAFVGDTVTVFVDGLLDGDIPEDEEAVAVFVYDGLGDMTGVELFEGHLSISSDELTPVTVADIARSDNSSLSGNDEDLFIDVDGGGNLAVCGVGSCPAANLYVGPGNSFVVATSGAQTVNTHDFVNDGTVEFNNNTMEVSGSWFNNATTSIDTSTVIFTATTSTESLTDADSLLNFHNVTFGQTSGAATWTASNPVDINGALAVNYGTLDRSTQPITVAGALSTGVAGFWTGIGTTTFDGTGSAAWTDTNLVSQNIGNVVVDGTSRVVVIGSDVRANSVFIGANDRLNAGGSNDIFISGNFTNTNIFNAQSSQIVVDGPATNAIITTNGSNLASFRASSTGGSVAFTESAVTLLGNFSIATGTVTLPTDVLNISGSFTNEGGVFAHNNAEVNFTGVGTKTITLLGTTFLNSFYDVRFSGNGDWTFLDSAATTTNIWTQTNGSVTMPSDTLTVGRNFSTSGGGDFDANGGEVVFLARSADTITTNGSEFFDVRIREGSPVRGGAFDGAWLYRDAITINAASIDDDLTDFPVYLDLADFGTDFFASINADGGDIRVTQGDGVTEVPREIVDVDTGAETGEMYFKAPTLASTTNTTFYIYYGNTGASDYAIDAPLGAENVWDDDFLAVYHMEETNAIDSTSFDRDATAVGSLTTTAGQIGTAVDINDTGGDDYINLNSNLAELDSQSEVTISTWVNVDEDGGDDVLFATQIGDPILLWDNISGTTNNDTYTFSVGNTGTGNRVDAAPTGISVGGTWQHVVATMQAGNRYIYVDGILRNSRSGSAATIPVNTGGSNIGRWQTSFDYGGLVDEFRISAIERSAEWVAAEFANMDNTSSFYTVTSGIGAQTRTFADTNTTIANDLVIESARAQFPTGNLFIGGSFDNNSEFTNSNGTVVFNATTTGNTVAASSSVFYDLTFDGVGGGWNVIENATATNAIELSNGDDFTVDSGIILESTGTFFTQLSNASTTWTGSTLRLSGPDHEINDKAGDGDDFATVSVVGDVDISMWNSTAATYDTQDTASIYSQDHAGVDGDLYIFGDYQRTTGTEYWNYATDFDGTDLTGGSERQVNVRIVNGGRVAVTGAALEMLGTAAASTTVDAQTGTFAWELDRADLSGEYFTATGGDVAGLQLLGSSTVSTFANAEFVIPTASAAISLSSTTVDQNPATQFFNIDFVSGGGSTNIDLLDTPTSFWWLRNGAGDRYGENFDNGDGNPGSVRWDDSNYQIDISGVVYGADQTTPLGGPTCDGSTTNVRVVVNGGAYTDAVSCDGVTGAYNFVDVSYIGDPVVQVYLDTAGGSTGAVVTRTPTADITDLDLYANYTIVRHELTAPITIADLALYDSSDDADLPYTAATSATPTLVTNANTGLFVWPSKTFVPGGSVTLAGDANANNYEGTLELGANATFTGASTTYTLAGSLLAANGASFNIASSTFVFNATTTGKVINSSSTIAFNTVQFTGAGGSWSLDSNITASNDVTVDAGTLQGTGDLTLFTGELTGNGSVDMTGGTVKIDQTNTFGGTNPWSFNNLTLGSGVLAGVTTPAGGATTTVRDTFTISAAHFYDAGSSVINLAGDGAVFVETGTFLEDTSTIQYSGATPNVLATPYYNLLIDDAVTSVAAVAPPIGLQVLNDLTIGTLGTASLNLTTNDPLTSVAGDLVIGASGTLIGSDSNTLQAFGDWTNEGAYIANSGTVSFNSPDTASIDPGNSAFADAIFNGTGPYTMLANATATNIFNLSATTEYTQQSGTTLAVGGQFINQTDGVNTVWTNTTLSLYGGQAYEINTKTKADDYETILVAANTHPRLWNSSMVSVVTATDASLYAMNHNDVDGDLYIYGDYINSSFTDSWSYAFDFDGAPLTLTARQANVYVEGGGSVLYTGGSLGVLGSSSASTTLQNFGAGTYDLTIGGTASTDWRYVVPRDLGSTGISFTGTPSVDNFSFLDLLVEVNGASAVTVAGSVIDANPAKTFTNDYFNADTGVTGAVNVTATGASVSSWRFTNGFGDIEGEAFDADGGDPGEIVWEDSAQEVTIAGNVYSNEGSIVSLVCDGSTNNIVLRVAGLTTYSGSCDGTTGAYSIPSVAFSANDTMTLYIDGEAVQAANVSIDPVSNISNFDLYEDRVIVRHEGANPITIADMSVWDSSDDADIPFTVTAGALTLPTDTKLIVWNSKTFEPQGDVTVGDSIELFTNAQYQAANTETHSVGASLIVGTGAVLTAAESEFIFTSAVGGQTIDINEAQLHTVSFTGAGAWTITDPTFTAGDDVTITAGALTLPTGTTTIAGSFDNTGGSFDANSGLLLFTATDGGNTVAFGGSDASEVQFNGIGSWTFTDANATTTGSFNVATGTVTLPSSILTVGEDFVVTDTIAHAGGTVRVTGVSGGNVVTLSGNDLTNLTIAAPAGGYTLTDVSAAFLGDLILTDGNFTVGTGTLSIGGSFDVSGGTYANGTGTLLFNSTDGGEFIDPGVNDLYNVVIAGAGGWTLVDNATTTNNFTLTNAGTFTFTSGSQLYVGGVFTNNVGGGATTWTGTTLVLDGGNEYETNTKLTSFESYENLVLGENTDISSWRSDAVSVEVPVTSSWYSQDHGATDGLLHIYGDYHIGTTTEYWSANTDFDGAALGSPRTATVSIVDGSTITVDGGSLQIIGTPANITTIQNQGAGLYTFAANAGTLNANNYDFGDLDSDGLQLSGSISVPSLSNGYFTQAANGSNLITLVADVVNNNASLVITDTGFATGGFSGGANVTLDATTTNSWNFTGEIGDFWGEDFDVDGFDACSSIRWDDSDCLLTEQTNYRWRNDDGGEGAPAGTWYDVDWSDRQRLRIINDDAFAYASTAVKMTVAYDADMQTDFEDLRFTDSDGVTLINHWIEKVTVSDNAIVWIQVPTLAADSVSEVYMYYGNVVAADSSDGAAVFAAFEDFEDNNITEYAGTPGDLALFSTNSTFAYGGGFGLDTDGNESGRTTNGITRSDVTTQQGQSIRFMQYIDTGVGSGDEVCTIFAATGAPASRTNYAVCIDQVGTDRVSIVEDVNDTENSGTVLGTANFGSLSTGWHEILIDWETDDSIDVVVVEESSGSVIATTTATDSTRSTGSIGFTYWFQNGGWDSFVAWPRTETIPTVFFGDEQSDGGATWAGAQNTPTGGFAFGDTARLRVAIENSGLPIVNQQFRLEYAPKLTAPSCEAVNVANFDPVPNAASCGSDAVCMTTSPNVSDGDATTDHLVTDGGDFVAGEVVTSPNNRTASYDLGQNLYTEIEYALNLTVNATNDAYCFRVTDDGSSLDSYSNLPELTLAFDPVITNVTLNDGLDISLVPGTTTTVVASSTVTDFNGVGDLVTATTTFYTTSAGALCTPNDNNCYVATSSCSFTSCSGTSCSLQCNAPFAFHADPTDDVGDPDEWFAFMEVSDTAGGVDLEGSIGVELFTIRALDVQNDIAYGAVDINDDTGSFNPMVSLVNIGNEPIDVTIGGSDMTDGAASVIPAAQQLFATSTFTYTSCIGCQALSVIGTDVEVDLPKPIVSTPAVADEIYWGIEVPFGTNSASHTGLNSFTAISD